METKSTLSKYFSKKTKQILILIVTLFLTGSLNIFIGFAKGLDMSSELSRPWGANSWTISGELTTACTYTPVIIGISLILLSLIFSVIIFMKWVNQSEAPDVG